MYGIPLPHSQLAGLSSSTGSNGNDLPTGQPPRGRGRGGATAARVQENLGILDRQEQEKRELRQKFEQERRAHIARRDGTDVSNPYAEDSQGMARESVSQSSASGFRPGRGGRGRMGPGLRGRGMRSQAVPWSHTCTTGHTDSVSISGSWLSSAWTCD